MPLEKDLIEVLRRHNIDKDLTAKPQVVPGIGAAASWIREIITGDQEFDEEMLTRVANVVGKTRGR